MPTEAPKAYALLPDLDDLLDCLDAGRDDPGILDARELRDTVRRARHKARAIRGRLAMGGYDRPGPGYRGGSER